MERRPVFIDCDPGIDDAVALSTRMYQDYDGQIGLFAEDCSASFSHSSIHIQSTPIK